VVYNGRILQIGEIRMKIGMPTLLETRDIDACVALCRDISMDFIELNMNFPQYQVDTIDIEHLKKQMKENHLFYTIHLEEELNVCGYNKEVTAAYLNTVRKTIDIAKQLKAPILNMHMAEGIYITLPGERVYLFGQYKDLYLKMLNDFRVMCETAIGESEIKICIENCNGYSEYAKEGIELLLESKVFALTFDIGHNHTTGGMDETFIREHKDRLIHMHFHDAVAGKNHLALGDGEIDLVNKFALAKECGCRCVLETKTIAGLKESVGRLKKYI
jgi:sugar phosphate isomerase/epimerase